MKKRALALAAVAGGAASAVMLVPVALSAVGFTSAGIAASSIAAGMMSSAAIANGGGVAAGSLVAVLQSAGAAGLTTAMATAVGSAGGVVGGVTGLLLGRGRKPLRSFSLPRKPSSQPPTQSTRLNLHQAKGPSSMPASNEPQK